MSMLQNRNVQIGGGVGAVALLAAGFFLWPESSTARIAKMCGPAPEAIADTTLAALVKSGVDAIGQAISTPNAMTEVENNSVRIFRETPDAQRAAVQGAFGHAVCSAVVTNASSQEDAERKLATAQEAVLKGVQTATEEHQAKMTACVAEKKAAAAAMQPFVIKGEARAKNAAADGKEVIDAKTVCQTAPAGFDFISAQVRKVACADDARCTMQEVRYAPDADGNKQACVDFEAKSEAKAFGQGGFLTVELFGEITKPVTPELEASIQAECGGAPAATPAATDPAAAAPVTTEPTAPAAPEAAPAAPEAAPAATPEPAPAAPVTP